MSNDERGAGSERNNIGIRVANFKATQEKFQREREVYFAATLEKARGDWREPKTRDPFEGPMR
jgi:hypothetical protein